MKRWLTIFLVSLHMLSSCRQKNTSTEVEPQRTYVPTDVLVKTKNDFTISQVFNFINSYDHDVEYIDNRVYRSAIRSDSLQYVLDYLNKKSYTNDGKVWFVGGYVHYQTQAITIFPRLYHIKDLGNQKDWLQSMKILKLTEVTDQPEIGGTKIYFHVPKTEEEQWMTKFRSLDFVEWVELNYYSTVLPL